MTFFKNFPIVEYNDNFVRNIFVNTRIDPSSSLLDYTMKDKDQRTDIIADKYYGDFYYDWLVKLSNYVVDPYHDLGLSDSEFKDYIISKYGSVENAQEKIMFYRNDWRNDNSVLTTAEYEVLPASRKKYYKEILDYRGNITGYERKEEDWIVSTNRLVSIEIANANTFTVDSKIVQGSNTAYVASSNNTHVLAKHLEGTIANTSIDGNAISSVTVVAESIPAAEEFLWEIVYALDYEREQNAEKRKIKLLDNRLKSQAEEEIVRKMNE